MKAALLLSPLLVLLSPRCSAAQNSIIRLTCTYSYLAKASGDRTPTSGNYLLTIHYTRGGRAVIDKQDVGAEYIGTANAEEIRGKTEYRVGSMTEKEKIAINLLTGTFLVSSNHGLIFGGTCRPTSGDYFELPQGAELPPKA